MFFGFPGNRNARGYKTTAIGGKIKKPSRNPHESARKMITREIHLECLLVAAQ